MLGEAKVICFDADETLIDFRPAMREALRLSLLRIQTLVPGSGTLTVEDLVAERNAVAAEMGARASMEAIRHEAFRRSLTPLGASDETVNTVTHTYLADRFRLARPYADVIPTLNLLRGRYTLGLATNGNSYPERAGLAAYFSFVVYASECGFRKPELRFFEAVRQAAHNEPAAIVYVGDSIAEDVAGATRAGFRTVWINRKCIARSSARAPDGEISSLTELPQMLALV